MSDNRKNISVSLTIIGLLIRLVLAELSPFIDSDACIGIENGTLIPNPLECESFYACLDEQLTELVYCPENSLFNPDKQMCDLIENVICDLSTTTPETTSTSTTTTTTTTTTSTTTTSTTTTTTPATTPITTTHDPNIEDGIFCPLEDNPIEIIFIPSKIDCERYYICYHNKPNRFQCVPGMFWNQDQKKCDYPENVICEVTTTSGPFPTCPPTGINIYPHPFECQLFIYCNNGQRSIQQCPLYYHWDIFDRKCLFRDTAKCALD